MNDKIKIALIIAALLFVIVVYIVTRRNRQEAKDTAEAIEIIASGETDPSTGIRSYNNAKYQALAAKIYGALKGLGTDEQALYSALNELRSDEDAKALDLAFGIKQGESLGAWIAGDGEQAEVNKLLESKGINYKFPILEIWSQN